jgi:Fe-S cluster assembly protein SufD
MEKKNPSAAPAPASPMQAGTHEPAYAKDWAPLGTVWLDELRRSSLERFLDVGFPTRRDEEWRFTDPARIARVPFQLAGDQFPQSAADAGQRHYTFGHDAVCELVFVNGHFHPRLSKLGKLPRGVKAGRLAEAFDTDRALVEQHLARHAEVNKNPFVALNTAFLRDGAFIHLSRGSVVETPIHLLFLSTSGEASAAAHPRVLVIAEENVEATIVETYAGAGSHDGRPPYFTNAVTEIVAGADCRIDHCKLQQESLSAFHVATMQVTLGDRATFVSHSASIGGRLTRNDLNVVMAGERADATLNGLVLIDGTQHVDNHTLLDHARPNCPSHELYKHVLGGRATGVFKGKILVRPDSQKTDAKQTSKALLLSDEAHMNSQPALEIYADDVKCTHGSTIGPVDEEMVFYLRSRGISLEASRHLLTYAFAADITRRIRVEPVRRRLEDFMAAQHGLPQDLRITDLGAHDEAARNS